MQNQLNSSGLMFILSSPSGAGKTTLAKSIIASNSQITLSVSVTTRQMRQGETEGEDYFFVSQNEYSELLKNNMLIEHITLFGNGYGTPKNQTEKALLKGCDVLYDIDWRGALELIKYKPEKIVSIFILPPSIETLERRLRNRAADNEETIQKRLSEAKSEISKCPHYDYIIINHDIDHSLKLIQSIITAERIRSSHFTNLQSFLSNLSGEVTTISEIELVQTKNVNIIDVRENHEWLSGHLNGTLNIPLQKLLAGEFELDKSKPCIVYCQHGVRSLTAAKFLKNSGFHHVTHLKDGLACWQGKLEID